MGLSRILTVQPIRIPSWWCHINEVLLLLLLLKYLSILRFFFVLHENEKKRLYSERVLDIEHGTFTPLVFTTTGGMGKECLKYHSRLAQLIAIKKGEQYAKTISWIRTRTSFALLRSALVCLRGSRTRRVPCDIKNVDIDVEVVEGAIKSYYWCVSLLHIDLFISLLLLFSPGIPSNNGEFQHVTWLQTPGILAWEWLCNLWHVFWLYNLIPVRSVLYNLKSPFHGVWGGLAKCAPPSSPQRW